MINGTQGYREEAEDFIRRTESLSFETKHQHILNLIPATPSYILDIGAGTGADAASLANLGHQVLAVEPTDELRVAGMALHPSSRIEWGNDSLPDLKWTRARAERFDFILLSGVWMHLDEPERRRALPHIAHLMNPGGILTISLRHGPIPPGRRMFEVSAEETIRLAQTEGMACLVNVKAESVQLGNQLAGVTWTHLAFKLSSLI